MFKSITKFNTLFIVLAALAFTACEKEEIISSEEAVFTEDFTVTERGIVHGPDGNRMQCYKLIFPVTLAFPDETTAEAADADALKQILKDWRTNNPDASERPHIAFPYEVELKDGTIATIETEEDAQELRQDCRVNRPHRPSKCFRLVYPVTINFPDGTTAEAADAETFHDLIKTWKEDNPDAEGRPKLAFPYQVELRNGDIVTIESEVDLQQLPFNCRTRPRPRPKPCYQLIYPVTLVLPGEAGETVEVADKPAMYRILKEWKENNPGATERPELLFPYDVRLRDGTLSTVESEEDLQELKESCETDRPARPKCFRRAYPLTLEYPGGRTARIETPLEHQLRLRAWKRENPNAEEGPEVAFPFTVFFRNGGRRVVNNQTELDLLKMRCAQETR